MKAGYKVFRFLQYLHSRLVGNCDFEFGIVTEVTRGLCSMETVVALTIRARIVTIYH